MLGFRGASRYYDPRYREGFALECRAMQKVRQEMGLINLKLLDVRFISSLPVMQQPACKAWADKRHVQIV
jgi:hypothetical protein